MNAWIRLTGFSLLLLSLNPLFCQTTFQRVFSDAGTINTNDVLAVPDGYILAGRYIMPPPGNDRQKPFLMKIDLDGQFVWCKYFTIANESFTTFNKIVVANDGGFVAVGIRDGDLDPQILIVKTDANGEIQWKKIIKSNRRNLGYWIYPVSDGYIVSGRSTSINEQHTILTKLNNEGQTVWSKRYAFNPGDWPSFLGGLVRGDTIFAGGSKDSVAIFCRFNALTGEPLSSQMLYRPNPGLPGPYDQSLIYMAPASNGDVLLAQFGYTPSQSGNTQDQWVCRLSSDGDLRWSKTYPNVGNGRIIALSDGTFVLVPYPPSYNPILIKINGDGEVLWSYHYGTTGFDQFTSATEAPDGGIIAVGSIILPNGKLSMLVVKTDANGLVADCCAQTVYTTGIPYPVNIVPTSMTAVNFDETQDATVQPADGFMAAEDFCPPVTLQVDIDILFCPGDSVVLDGTAYTNPGTVIRTVDGPACDSVITYHLQFSEPDTAASLSIFCPPDVDVTLPDADATIPVGFNAPVVQSDCSCPGILVMQTAGPPTGSLFSAGNHTICFQARDSCGNVGDCCFQVRVEVQDDSPCDAKPNGCLDFALLRITADDHGRRSYHIRVQNNCLAPLAYAAFQLPAGTAANQPANNDIYYSPGGHSYSVRNPNYSPFYSVRFQSLDAGIKDGQTDIFRYSLPPWSAPDYLHCLIKLEDQSYVEAYLNTFNCPVEQNAFAAEVIPDRDAEPVAPAGTLLLYPNPAGTELFLSLSGWEGKTAGIRIFNAQGQLVYNTMIEVESPRILLDLPSGIYAVEARTSAGRRYINRLAIR